MPVRLADELLPVIGPKLAVAPDARLLMVAIGVKMMLSGLDVKGPDSANVTLDVMVKLDVCAPVLVTEPLVTPEPVSVIATLVRVPTAVKPGTVKVVPDRSVVDWPNEPMTVCVRAMAGEAAITAKPAIAGMRNLFIMISSERWTDIFVRALTTPFNHKPFLTLIRVVNSINLQAEVPLPPQNEPKAKRKVYVILIS